MRIFKHRHFNQWAKDEGIADSLLKQVVVEMEKGLFGAHLGGGLYKKRVARIGQGKRDGYRALLAFKKTDRTLFVYGFAKNVRSNIAQNERKIYQRIVKDFLSNLS